MRYSRQREALCELLHSVTTHPDAEWLYAKLKEEYPNISLGTVYRNLRQLVESGNVLEISCGDSSHFDANAKEHYHMHCINCGRLIDAPMEKISLNIDEAINFEIIGCTLIINGICQACAEKS